MAWGDETPEKISLHDITPGLWTLTPWWLSWKGKARRRHWRWTVDHYGCHGTFYWQYSNHIDNKKLVEIAKHNWQRGFRYDAH